VANFRSCRNVLLCVVTLINPTCFLQCDPMILLECFECVAVCCSGCDMDRCNNRVALCFNDLVAVCCSVLQHGYIQDS